MHLSISSDIVSTKIYDKRDDFDFEIVNFPFLDGDVPRSTSYGVYISQLILFARASSYVADFNTRNKLLTQKLLKQGYRYHKLRKTFSKFYRRYYDLISKFQVGLKSLLRQGLSEPDFYGDLVYQLKKIVGSNNFSAQFIKIISHYKKIGYNINVLQHTACLVVNLIMVGNFAFLFNCTPVGRTSAILTRCYTQHALWPYIDSEINHIRHFIKIQFVNKGIEFINLPSIFKDKSVISSIPTYFENYHLL